MNGKLQVHGHCNGLKTTLLFALMWGVIMLIWWATGASQSTLGYYILIGLGLHVRLLLVFRQTGDRQHARSTG